MIVYLTTGAPRVPPWLAGFRPPDALSVELCRRDTAHGHLVGIGDPLVFDEPPMAAFCQLADGWRVALLGELEPLNLLRQQGWARSRRVLNLDGRRWQAPEILDEDGERAFLVAYGGPDFLPVLTAEQHRCQEVAEAARAMILTGGGMDLGPACRWAAVLLSATHHVSPEVMAALGLVDDRLVIETLEAATQLPLRKVQPADA